MNLLTLVEYNRKTTECSGKCIGSETRLPGFVSLLCHIVQNSLFPHQVFHSLTLGAHTHLLLWHWAWTGGLVCPWNADASYKLRLLEVWQVGTINLRGPALHQENSMLAWASAPFDWVPKWETCGADLNHIQSLE